MAQNGILILQGFIRVRFGFVIFVCYLQKVQKYIGGSYAYSRYIKTKCQDYWKIGLDFKKNDPSLLIRIKVIKSKFISLKQYNMWTNCILNFLWKDTPLNFIVKYTRIIYLWLKFNMNIIIFVFLQAGLSGGPGNRSKRSVSPKFRHNI